jgi:hypothetical protein
MNELKYDYELAEKTKYTNPLEIMSAEEYHKICATVLENKVEYTDPLDIMTEEEYRTMCGKVLENDKGRK